MAAGWTGFHVSPGVHLSSVCPPGAPGCGSKGQKQKSVKYFQRLLQRERRGIPPPSLAPWLHRPLAASHATWVFYEVDERALPSEVLTGMGEEAALPGESCGWRLAATWPQVVPSGAALRLLCRQLLHLKR